MANDNNRTLTESLLAASPFLVKVAELVLSLLCLILIYIPFDNRLQKNLTHAGIIYVAYCSAIVINGVLIASHLQGQRVPRRTLFIFSAICGLLFFIAGCVVLHDWWALFHSLYFHPSKLFMDLMICSGFLAIFNAFVFCADIYLTYRYD